MIAAEAVAVVLLAAGRSRRFGDADKLAAPLGGLPLGLHAARMLGGLPFASRVAVTRPGGVDPAAAGFVAVVNDDPAAGQARSLAIGIAAARAARPRAVLIALADMPFVTRAHVLALLAVYRPGGIVASGDGARRCPPALFDAVHLDRLERLGGDAGARHMLDDAVLVRASPGTLRDIDTPADLAGTR